MSRFHCRACGHTGKNPRQCSECGSDLLTKVELVEVPSDQITRGPLLHAALRPDLLERVRQVWAYLGPLDESASTFEQFELDFLRDGHPEREIKVWEAMAQSHRDYMARRPQADAHQVFAHVMVASSGKHDGSQMGKWLHKRMKRLGGIAPIVLRGPSQPAPKSQPPKPPDNRPAGDGQHRHGNH